MTYTVKQLNIAIGQQVAVRTEGWTIPMMVDDVKTTYGVVRIKVSPLSGQGSAWIDLGRVVRSSDSRSLTAQSL
jgi:hypothetical protein